LSTKKKVNNCSPWILYPGKVSFKTEGRIKILQDKQKLKQYITTKPSIQKILKESYIPDESKHSQERMGITKPQEKTRKIIREN
jgi:hypothetical protein